MTQQAPESARDRLMESILGLRTQGLPEWRDRAERELDAYKDEILREAATVIRSEADAACGADDPRWNGMNAGADLIDPDLEQR